MFGKKKMQSETRTQVAYLTCRDALEQIKSKKLFQYKDGKQRESDAPFRAEDVDWPATVRAIQLLSKIALEQSSNVEAVE